MIPSRWGNYEHGATLPKANDLPEIAAALGVPVQDLFDPPQAPTREPAPAKANRPAKPARKAKAAAATPSKSGRKKGAR